MILQSRGLLLENPVAFFLVIGIGLVGLIIGFTVHEFSHALTAYGEGDQTARRMGRLTFNPIKHIDPLGFALLLVVGFGWARPVQVDPYNLKHGRLGMSWVALAGPLSNFILAFLLGLVFRFDLLPAPGLYQWTWTEFVSFALLLIISYNFVLGIINLIPLPPLDGSKVVGGLLPDALYYPYLQFERYGWIPLIALVGVNLALYYAIGVSIIGYILIPPVRFLLGLAVGPDAAGTIL